MSSAGFPRPAHTVRPSLAAAAGALHESGDLATARELYDAAFELAEASGDVEALAEAALGAAGLWVHESRGVAGAVLLRTRLRRALALLDPDSPLALRIRVRLTAEDDYCGGDHTATLAILDEARASADPLACAEALSLAHHCVLGPEHSILRQSLALELVAESFRTSRRGDLVMGLLWHTVDLFLAGDPHAGRRLRELRALLAEQDHRAASYVVDAIEVMLCVRAGEFARADDLAHACAERGAAVGDIDAAGWFGAQLVAIRWYQGRLPELLPLLRDLVQSPTLSAVDSSYYAGLAVAAATAGDAPTAVDALAKVRGMATLPRSSTWLVTLNGMVEAADLLGDRATAAWAHGLLEPFAELPMSASLAVACFGSVQHALGVAMLTVGAVDEAIDRLSAAVERNRALGHRPAVVHSQTRYAEALLRRGAPEDVRKARATAAEAAWLAAELGMPEPDVRGLAAATHYEVGPLLNKDAASHEPLPVTAELTREGRSWRVTFGPRSALVKHSVGLLHLAVLVANPCAEIRALDLASGVVDVVGSPHDRPVAGPADQPLLDEAAARDYRRRLAHLEEEIDGHAVAGDSAKQAAAVAERAWLLAELAAATGLGGRRRGFADAGERARITVGKAIRRAIARIAAEDAAIGEHLRGHIQTGMSCSYRPKQHPAPSPRVPAARP